MHSMLIYVLYYLTFLLTTFLQFSAILMLSLARMSKSSPSMKQLTEKYPEEVEAQLFLILSKFALRKHPQGLEALFRKHPTHPGVLHYTMQVFGLPEYYNQGARKFLKNGKFYPHSDHPASLGMAASENYLNVVSSSGLGIHMTSHKFMRLGMWGKSLKSNLRAIKVNKNNMY